MEVSGKLHVLATLPRGMSPRYPQDRGLGGQRVVMDVVVTMKNSYTCQESNPSRLVCTSGNVIVRVSKYVNIILGLTTRNPSF
jgi:hypothetical protein